MKICAASGQGISGRRRVQGFYKNSQHSAVLCLNSSRHVPLKSCLSSWRNVFRRTRGRAAYFGESPPLTWYLPDWHIHHCLSELRHELFLKPIQGNYTSRYVVLPEDIHYMYWNMYEKMAT